MQTRLCPTVLAILMGLLTAQTAHGVGDDFAINPLLGGSPWSFGVGDNANSQFAWSPGALAMHVDTSLPTARLDLPLGQSLDDSSSFVLSARFSFHITSAPDDQFAQLAFGLTNHTLTGGDRTGLPGNFTSDNTFNTFEFNYFPNLSPTFGGHTLSPSVFGESTGGDAFSNVAPIFFPDSSILSKHAPGLTELPQDTTLEAHLAYDGINKLVTLSMYQVVGNALNLLDTGLTPLDLGAFGSGYDVTHPFVVDSLSIMAYHDGFTSTDAPSLVGDMTFQNINLVVPEPSGLVLILLGGGCAIGFYIRRRG